MLSVLFLLSLLFSLPDLSRAEEGSWFTLGKEICPFPLFSHPAPEGIMLFNVFFCFSFLIERGLINGYMMQI